jgi:hypothetical protein
MLIRRINEKLSVWKPATFGPPSSHTPSALLRR